MYSIFARKVTPRHRPTRRGLRQTAFAVLVGWGIGVGLSGCAINPVSGKRDFILVSEEREISIGRQGDADIRKEYRVYPDRALRDYVQTVGERVAVKSHRPGLIYHFTLLDTPDVNAFALPGGYVYITRGLLAYLNSEAELAAVLGHEVGHVTARHGVRQYSAALAAGLGYAIGSVLVPELQRETARSVFNLLSTSLLRGYGREHELEADRLGAEYLARGGYDPDAMIKVIGILKNQEEFERRVAAAEGREPRVYHGVFATHPSNDRRLQEVVGQARRFKAAQARRIRRVSYLRRLDGLVFGDSAEEGIRRGRRFYHKGMDFKLAFPKGWPVENRPAFLEAGSPDGNALLRVLSMDRNRRLSPRAFMIQRLKQQVLRHGQSLRIHGNPAYTAIGSLQTRSGVVPARIIVIYYRDKAMVFLGAAKQGLLDRYDRHFLDTGRSFQSLTGADKKLAESLRIRIIRAKTGDTFAKLARASAIPTHPEQRLRLINDKFPTGEPRPGELLKIVR